MWNAASPARLDRSRPSPRARPLLDDLAQPALGAGVRGRELGQRERRPDAAAQLLEDASCCAWSASARAGSPRLLVEAPIAVLPLAAGRRDRRHPRERIAVQQRSGPSSRDLGEHRLAELVPGAREAKATCAWRHLSAVGVREPPIPRSSDAPPSVPRSPAASSRRMRRCSRSPARGVAQRRVVRDRGAPALDPAGGLEPGDGGDQVAAREVVRRRERLAVRRVRLLLGHGRQPPRAAGDDAPERARLSAELTGDGGAIVHAVTVALSLAWRRCQAAVPLTMKRCSPGRT